jgi:1,4-alpha-glucan branching enzyme
MRERIPDPTAPETFTAAKLDWNALEEEPHAAWLQRYQRLLAVRHRELVPLLGQIREAGRAEVVGKDAVTVRWVAGERVWVLEANLSDAPVNGFSATAGEVRWSLLEPGRV